VAAWQKEGLCHGDIKPGNIAVDMSTPETPAVSIFDIEGSVALQQSRDVTLKWPPTRMRTAPAPAGAVGCATGAGAGACAGAGASEGAGAGALNTLGERPSESLGDLTVAPSPLPVGRPEKVLMFTLAYARRSLAGCGAVLATNTTDWYSLGCTLHWLAATVGKVREAMCLQLLRVQVLRVRVVPVGDAAPQSLSNCVSYRRLLSRRRSCQRLPSLRRVSNPTTTLRSSKRACSS
jgi:hypothetical protein